MSHIPANPEAAAVLFRVLRAIEAQFPEAAPFSAVGGSGWSLMVNDYEILCAASLGDGSGASIGIFGPCGGSALEIFHVSCAKPPDLVQVTFASPTLLASILEQIGKIVSDRSPRQIVKIAKIVSEG